MTGNRIGSQLWYALHRQGHIGTDPPVTLDHLPAGPCHNLGVVEVEVMADQKKHLADDGREWTTGAPEVGDEWLYWVAKKVHDVALGSHYSVFAIAYCWTYESDRTPPFWMVVEIFEYQEPRAYRSYWDEDWIKTPARKDYPAGVCGEKAVQYFLGDEEYIKGAFRV